MRRRQRQSGFSVVEAIIFVVAIGIISTAGWLIYQHNRTKPTNAASNGQPTQQTTTTTTTPTAATLDIKEWGVHMTLDSTTASMYYYIKPNHPDVAYLSLKTVSTIAPDCAADKISLGAIVRLTPAEQQTAPNASYSVKGTIQIGNYWYGFSTSPTVCIVNDTQNAAIHHALPTYNLQAIINTFNTLAAD